MRQTLRQTDTKAETLTHTHTYTHTHTGRESSSTQGHWTERKRGWPWGPLTNVGVSSAHSQHVDLPDGVALGLLDGGVVRRLLPADVDDLHGVLLVRGLLHHPPHRTADAPVTQQTTTGDQYSS